MSEQVTKKPSISEQAYQYVRSLILAGDLKPGTVFTERKLSEKFNASRTPLRTAIARLIQEDLVEKLENGTVVIRQVPLGEFLEIMVIRRQLESEAAAQAAAKANPEKTKEIIDETHAVLDNPEMELEPFWAYDDRFHRFLADESNMPLLAQMIGNIRDRARMCHVVRMERNFTDQATEHLHVLDAIAAHDQDAAREAMIAHTDKVRQRFLRWLAG